MERARASWGALTVAIVTVAVAILVLFVTVRAVSPAEQAHVSIDQWDWTADGVAVQGDASVATPPDRRLLDGDIVTAIDGRSLESWATDALDPTRTGPAAAPGGGPLRIDVLRAGAPLTLLVDPAPAPVGGLLAAGWPLLAFLGLLVAVSAFIAIRRPEHPLARVLVVGSVGNLASSIPWQLGLAPTDLVRGGPGLVAFLLTGPLNLLFWSAALHVVLIFPVYAATDRHRTAVALTWLAPPIALLGGVVATRLTTPSTLLWIGGWASVESIVVGVLLSLAMLGVIPAYRRAHPDLRGDVRWIALAFGAAGIATLVFVIVPVILTGHPLASRPALALVAIPIPVTLAIAVLRDRLFEIDVLRRSREALVVAREDERRRLRRDLHDGLGPSLAAMTVKLGLARRQMRDDPAGAEALLDQVTGETQAAIAEVRRLASGLRPPALDEVGLVEAVRRRADGFAVEAAPGVGIPPAIEVVGPERLPALPAAVEVAAYRIAVEAMTNAVRHARATRCRVGFEADDAEVRLVVEDDGAGLAPGWRMGVGLASMRERAAELGGRCDVGPGATGGTRVDARLPLGAG